MQRSRAIVGLVFLIFFVISFLTNILGPLVPDIISAFSLSLTLAGFLPFSFFVAYGVMSIPAGTLVERRGERVVMAAAFAAACAGATLFALVPGYRIAIGSLFLIGLGMAALQVAINPLLRVAGGESTSPSARCSPSSSSGSRPSSAPAYTSCRASRRTPRATGCSPPSRGSCRRSCRGSRSTGSSPS
jgi:fucose permease